MGYRKSVKFSASFIIVTLISVLLFSVSFVPYALPQHENNHDNKEEQSPPSQMPAAEPAAPVAGAPEEQKTGPVPPEKPQQAEQSPLLLPEKKPVVQPRVAPPQKSVPTVSFFFDDADIFEVVQTVFGDILKANYIIDQQVKGRVNFRTVTPIPRDEVLSVIEIIFRLNGIGFVEEGGLYRIIPLGDVSRELIYSQIGKTPEKVAIEMFTFRNLDLKESMPDIENALGLHLKGGTVRLVPVFRMNALIVIASSREQLDYIKQWADVFDTMYGIARPKIYVYPLQNSKASHIASLLQSILSGSGASVGSPATSTTPARTEQQRTTTQPGAAAAPATTTTTTATQRTGAGTAVSSGGTFVSRETKIFADEITNSLIILAIPTDYAFLDETIKRLDTQPRQVVIEALIARVDLTDNLSFGFAWSLQTDINITGLKPFNKDINLSGDAVSKPFGTTFDKGASDGFTFIATDPSGIVRARLTAALKDSRAKILAAPHVLVSDNREARIQVGSQIPLATSTTTTPISGGTEFTNTTTSTIQYKDIGIILNVKPQINDSGLVSLVLTQEVSSQGDTVKIAGSDFASINKTEATTELVAQDGQTIIIGGLIREDVTNSKDGIPLLSRIPLIGYLFSNTSRTSTRTELIILLTPHVVKSQTEVRELTSDYIRQYEKTSRDQDIKEFIQERGMKDEGNEPGEYDAGE